MSQKPTAEVLREVAGRFGQGGCCGVKPKVTTDDIAALGLDLPERFLSKRYGPIAPNSGWKALCVYVYETLTGEPLIVRRDVNGHLPDTGEVVAKVLLAMADATQS